MLEHYVRPVGSPPVNGYSHAVALQGRVIVLSGQVPLDEQGRLVGEGQPETQIKQVFENIRIALEAAGAHMSDVAKITVYLTDMEDLPAFRNVRNQYFSLERPPASSLIQISRLVHPAFRIEMEAIATVPD